MSSSPSLQRDPQPDSNTPSLNSPPPPYSYTLYGSVNVPGPSSPAGPLPIYVPPPTSCPRIPHHDSDETTALVSTNKSGNKVKHWVINYLLPVFFTLMMVSVLSFGPMVSSAVRHDITEWQRVRDTIQIDIRRLTRQRTLVSDDLQQLRIERDEKRREWELEREENDKRRRGHVPFWGQPRLLNGQCPPDRHRRYETRMYNLLVEDDWYAACMREPIKIAGRDLASPNSCINFGLDDGVRGFWSIEVNTRECPRTIWDRLRNIFR